MAALVDLILEVFRWKTTKRKQFFDSEIQSQIDAMGRHHDFDGLQISIQTAFTQARNSLKAGANDLDLVVGDLEKSILSFDSAYRRSSSPQDASLSQIHGFLEVVKGDGNKTAPIFTIIPEQELNQIRRFFDSIENYFYKRSTDRHMIIYLMREVETKLKETSLDRDKLTHLIEWFLERIPIYETHINTNWKKINVEYAKLRILYLKI